jgi:hypothetical protein
MRVIVGVTMDVTFAAFICMFDKVELETLIGPPVELLMDPIWSEAAVACPFSSVASVSIIEIAPSWSRENVVSPRWIVLPDRYTSFQRFVDDPKSNSIFELGISDPFTTRPPKLPFINGDGSVIVSYS